MMEHDQQETQHMESHNASAHVHFTVTEPELQEGHDSQIVVRPEAVDKVSVHLGFLQYKHRYEVRFCIPDQLGEEVIAEPAAHIRLEEIRPAESGMGHDLIIDLLAHKEKLLKEPLVLTSTEDEKRHYTIIIMARVLGKGKGTPSLKDGIHCTGVEMDEDDMSDWQGF
ncbi:PREDICTED: UPF0687 protein C20orf27 homolog [Priapulus caudatus]|uniref:Adipose-secreted signaling protein n=1 Tax=Priapulus caudatus TaxID=37621 RepID=A0ABM1E6L8_PRICU|nr:PREDICTED: UPF0687 protein C20orf27 homolog [Priapulus caudatus]